MGLRTTEVLAILNELRSGDHIFGELILVQPAYARAIIEHIQEGRMRLNEVRTAIHVGIIKCGRRCFEDHVSLKIPPSHTYSGEAIGYACLHGEITKKEASQMEFLPGDSLKNWMWYGSDLLNKIVDRIYEQASKHDPLYIK